MPPACNTSEAATSPSTRRRIGAHAQDHFAWAERLDHVVVGAELQADQSVGFLGAGSEHDDGHGRFAAEDAADVQPVNARQHQVEDHQVGPGVPEGGQRHLPIAGRDHAEAGLLQVALEHRDDLPLVIHHQDRFRHRPCSAPLRGVQRRGQYTTQEKAGDISLRRHRPLAVSAAAHVRTSCSLMKLPCQVWYQTCPV